MKSFAITSIIAMSLLMVAGCKKQDQESQQPAQDVQVLQAVSETQSNTAAPNTDAVEPNTEAVEPNTDDSAAAAVPEEPIEYVDIADWCRPGMAEQISAQEWAKANNAFGLKFLAQTKGNTVFSPYSIERALGMTLDGACGTTASEMLSVLELPNAMRLSISGRDVDDAMKSVNEDTMLEIENTLWPDVSMTLPEDYLARISAGYRNKSITLDYGADPEKARVTINDDVAKTTHDRIKDLIPPGGVSSDTKLVLTNAVYFKSKWLHLFKEEDTYTEEFYNSDKQIETKMMYQVVDSHKAGNRNVCIADDYAIYDLEFDSAKEGNKGTYVMRIVLPTINDKRPMNKRMKQLEKVEKQLSADFTSGCKNEYFDKVYVSMPKFKLEPDIMSIRVILKSVGMNKAFDGKEAEFYAMPNTTPQPSDPSKYLYIDDVFHKAFIEIDEKGGEAAAATAVVMGAKGGSSSPKPVKYYHFTIDHPFLYMIIEKSTGAAIFMGRVTDL